MDKVHIASYQLAVERVFGNRECTLLREICDIVALQVDGTVSKVVRL